MPATRSLFGFHAVTARLRQRADAVHDLYVLSGRQDARLRELVARAEAAAIAVHPVDGARLDALAGHGRHQGVVAIVDDALPHVTLDDVLEPGDTPPLLLVLDGVTDPHNLGACLRSADAFGAQAVIVPKDRAVGVNATVAKAACGAADTVPVVAVTNLSRAMREMKERGIWLLGADAGGESLVHRRLERAAGLGSGRGGRGSAAPHPRVMRPDRGHSARRQRREPECLRCRGHLPVRDAGRAGTGLGLGREPPL